MSEQSTIAVTGMGVASGTADECRIYISLNHVAESAAAALEHTAEIATKAIEALADVEAEHCEARTVGLSVHDFFDQSQQKVTAHVGSYQLELIVRPIDAAGSVLAALSSVVEDALQIRGITLGIEDPEPLQSRARRLAMQDAKRRAVELADEAGVSLGALVSIHDEYASPSPFNFAHTAARMPMAASAAANMPIEAGPVSASSSVTLVYVIEPGDRAS